MKTYTDNNMREVFEACLCKPSSNQKPCLHSPGPIRVPVSSYETSNCFENVRLSLVARDVESYSQLIVLKRPVFSRY